MSFAPLLLALVPALAGLEGPTRVTLDVPDLYLEDEPFEVSVSIHVSLEQGLELPAWAFSAEAFTVSKKALGKRRAKDKISLLPGQTFTTTVDLAPLMAELELEAKDFSVGWSGTKKVEPQSVMWLQAAEKGIDFMTLPEAQLVDYQVALQTNRGLIWLDLWPDVAPNHVRNFLDLSYTGFYDSTKFHRVIPGFMIQGGGARPGEQAPRKLKAEFNTKRHVRGVLSMARLGTDDNSATSEFFVMHAENAQLDGNYTAFGMMLFGGKAVDAIVMTGDSRFSPKTSKGYTPTTPQVIKRAVVVKSHSKR